jgi:hypothetical protein
MYSSYAMSLTQPTSLTTGPLNAGGQQTMFALTLRPTGTTFLRWD